MTRALTFFFHLVASSASLAATAITDPVDSRATHCGFGLDGATVRTYLPVNPLTGGAKNCLMNLDSVAAGAHTINATIAADVTGWPRLESDPSNTVNFSRPGVPAAPAGLSLQNGMIVSGTVAAAATHCGWAVNGSAKIDVPVGLSGVNKICRFDAASLVVGDHSVVATVVVADPLWGRLESAVSSPFAFAKPGQPGVPTGLKLVP